MSKPKKEKKKANSNRPKRLDMHDVLSRIDAFDFAQQISDGEVKRAGTNKYKIRCPDPSHADRNPSCNVQYKDGAPIWHCWSCGSSGNPITWLRMTEGKKPNFGEELERLCEIFRLDFSLQVDTARRQTGATTQKRKLRKEEWLLKHKEELSKIDVEPVPPLKKTYAKRLSDELAEDAESLEAFALRKHLELPILKDCMVHAALRPHKCGSTCDVDDKQHDKWTPAPVIRVPQIAHSQHEDIPTVSKTGKGTRIAGYQDIIPADFADIHFKGMTKRNAVASPYPAVGLNDVSGMDTKILLVEGVTDWLTAKHAAPGWVSVGALGSERMAATASLLSDMHAKFGEHDRTHAKETLLVIIGDGDMAGDKGAYEASHIWQIAYPSGGEVIRLRPEDGRDLSDEWVAASQKDADPAWFENALDDLVSRARKNRWRLCELPVFGGQEAGYYDPAYDEDVEHGSVSSLQRDNKPAKTEESKPKGNYTSWPTADMPRGQELFFIAQLDDGADEHHPRYLVRAVAESIESLRQATSNQPNVGILEIGNNIKLNGYMQRYLDLLSKRATKLLCTAKTTGISGRLNKVKVLEEWKT